MDADTVVVLIIVCAILIWAAIETTNSMRDKP